MAEDSNRDALAGPGALWEALRALLPPTKEELRLDLGASVEGSVVVLLQQAADLFYGGRRSECLQTSEAVLDYSWEKLNTGLWQDVDKDWRRVYAFGCLLKAMCLCEAPGDSATVAAALRACDMGLLMGAAIFDDILIKVAAVLQAHLLPGKRPAQGPAPEQPRFKKARNGHVSIPDMRSEKAVPRLHCPSLQHFRKHYLIPQTPVILEGVADHWPCMKKWSLEYIQEIAGCRTVPVEVGSRYTDEEWSQRLMTVSEFISCYILNESLTSEAGNAACLRGPEPSLLARRRGAFGGAVHPHVWWARTPTRCAQSASVLCSSSAAPGSPPPAQGSVKL
ncbi:bifunctional peptidase and arginyl-hydroxylase JMJD5 isoform X3 [Myotis daubentonii]|uniref:bifunctional peptidase and arginyl-hydroxylase JMJD5 isoform X3 n=1 Tax=Myotis daubentonii TaxID=98922 RepID=UPI00287329DB|nr:bifunctional peptidase and arginyl-hydroxylase JMJD5 isoform X3 [Myotis daubentonii]